MDLAKKLFLVIGNGFSIDYLTFINEIDRIDLKNLFRCGTEVPWPITGVPGFLSFKHCPNLWNLGARPTMSSVDAMNLIEDIITCVNVYGATTTRTIYGSDTRPNDIYIYAYKELLQYLKYLFVYYDKKLPNLPESSRNWPWIEFLKYAHESSQYSEITIVTYNYDIWLERLLDFNSIPYRVAVVGSHVENAKISIIKPHGSISFVHKNVLDKLSYSIKLNYEIDDALTDDFSVKYTELGNNYLVTPLIPPAGESSRFNLSWAKQIRESADLRAKNLCEGDELMICGSSYWSVDRAELDKIFVSCNPKVDVTMVNPFPSRTLTAVLTSVFSNFVIYSSTETLRGKIECQP